MRNLLERIRRLRARRLAVTVASILLGGSLAALAANTVFFTSIGDLTFPFSPPTGGSPGAIDNMAVGLNTPAAVRGTTVSATGAINGGTLTASQPVYTDASKNLTSTVPAGFSTGHATNVVTVAFAASPLTYTPTAGMKTVDVFICGGGGGGGSSAASATDGPGGGGGGDCELRTFQASDVGASVTVTIGAGGAAGTAGANSGGQGGETSFGSLLTAFGGGGGMHGGAAAGGGGAPGGPFGAGTTATGTTCPAAGTGASNDTTTGLLYSATCGGTGTTGVGGAGVTASLKAAGGGSGGFGNNAGGAGGTSLGCAGPAGGAGATTGTGGPGVTGTLLSAFLPGCGGSGGGGATTGTAGLGAAGTVPGGGGGGSGAASGAGTAAAGGAGGNGAAVLVEHF